MFADQGTTIIYFFVSPRPLLYPLNPPKCPEGKQFSPNHANHESPLQPENYLNSHRNPPNRNIRNRLGDWCRYTYSCVFGMPFRINAKNFFLTYPNCSLDLDQALDQLKTIFSAATYIVVAQELHANGQPHLHSLVCLPRKLDVRNQSFADLAHNNRTWHGSYEGCRSTVRARNYVIKDGLFVEWGTFPARANSSRFPANHTNRPCPFQAALESSSQEEGFEVIRAEAPRDYLIFGRQILDNLGRAFPTSSRYSSPFLSTSFTIPPILSDWMSQNLIVMC